VFGCLQTRDRRLERRARRIVGPRVVVPFMDSRRALRESAGLKDRNSDRPGGGFGLLSGLDGTRGELHEMAAALLPCHQGCPPKCPTTSNRVTIPWYFSMSLIRTAAEDLRSFKTS